MPRKIRLTRAEWALYAIPVIFGAVVMAASRLHHNSRPAKPAGFSVDSVAFAPCGRAFATGDSNGVVQFWDAASGKHLQTLQGLSSRCIAVAWSPHGNYFAASTSVSLRVFDGYSGTLLHTFRTTGFHTSTLAFSADDRFIAVGLDQTSRYFGKGMVDIRDVVTGKTVSLLGKTHPSADPSANALSCVTALAISPDGGSLAVYGGARQSQSEGVDVIRTYDLKTGKMRWEQTGADQGAILWMPNGKQILVGELKPALRNATTGEVQAQMNVPNGVGNWYLGLLQGGAIVAGDSNSQGQPLTFWNGSNGKLLARGGDRVSPCGADADAFAFSPDQKKLVYIDGNCDAQSWDLGNVDWKKLPEDASQLSHAKKSWILDPVTGTVSTD